MLPGFRFLFAAIVLSVSILVFGVGAAALLRAAHEEVASNPSWRSGPQEQVFAQQSEPQPAVLATLRVDPPPAEPKPADAAAAPEPSSPAPLQAELQPEPPKLETAAASEPQGRSGLAPPTEPAASDFAKPAPAAEPALPALASTDAPAPTADTAAVEPLAPAEVPDQQAATQPAPTANAPAADDPATTAALGDSTAASDDKATARTSTKASPDKARPEKPSKASATDGKKRRVHHVKPRPAPRPPTPTAQAAIQQQPFDPFAPQQQPVPATTTRSAAPKRR